MKKVLLGFGLLISCSTIGFSDSAEASEISHELVPAIEDTTSNATITPYIWASQRVTVKRVYSGRNAYIPSSIYHSQGTQSGTLYLGSHSFNSNSGLWTCYYTGTISGYI